MSPILIYFVVFIFSAIWSALAYRIEDAEKHFEEFIEKFGKKYQSAREKELRFEIFVKNLEKINKLNEESIHAVHGINQFTDMFDEEFSRFYTGLNSISIDNSVEYCKHATDSDITDNDAPESFDWRDRNVVTSVKDQNYCASCYAFSVVGNIEGQYAIKHKELVDLSPQQIVDCDTTSYGCLGGYLGSALRSVIEIGGIETEADYPYTKREMDDCYFEKNKVKVKVSDCRAYNLTSQEKLKQLLYETGPLTIGMYSQNVKSYTGGIISDKACGSKYIDHAVLLVGYGVEKDIPFWIVKNSWGESYGEKGYFRMERGENSTSCGMMKELVYTAIVE